MMFVAWCGLLFIEVVDICLGVCCDIFLCLGCPFKFPSFCGRPGFVFRVGSCGIGFVGIQIPLPRRFCVRLLWLLFPILYLIWATCGFLLIFCVCESLVALSSFLVFLLLFPRSSVGTGEQGVSSSARHVCFFHSARCFRFTRCFAPALSGFFARLVWLFEIER